MIRSEQLSASLEDYLEAIFWIIQSKGATRAKDIAAKLSVKASSVTGALQALSEKKYVNYPGCAGDFLVWKIFWSS
ncbi:metal-dependent transcriptional regulator [Planctomycetota bacterium]